MAQLSAAADPKQAKTLIESALRTVAEDETKLPTLESRSDSEYHLCGGVLLDDGQWLDTFQVRELTGADEEALTKIREDSKFLKGMIERCLIYIGNAPANEQTLEFLLSGDWDTVLIAIRIASFGPTYTHVGTCRDCDEGYETTVDLTKDIPRRTCRKEDVFFTVTGRTGNRYRVGLPKGSVNTRLLSSVSASPGEINTILLSECVSEINGQPVILPEEQMRAMSLSDRKTVLTEIHNRRIGPDLEGVTTNCPHCGAEQRIPLSTAALFL